ncbi:holo-ACP synthase [Paenibacillus beijingensis]|uniref:Holo-[acyl-carrier-protein] synthase n=1 Tax=Paenibacillus beijingensis TaxID=1126833 RepID=A0A0D5NGA4_9BACL|nr:holo-ACP synthase [Paenibacillus beijingensis]AJY74007.1 4'-phosphopantetheinyl transferase [Paenibacillus beijingensis]
MIIGIGHDLCDVSRVAKLLAGSSGDKFMARVLSGGEPVLAHSLGDARRAEFVAGRFAAKEAVAKALGCGIGASVGFTDIEIGRDERGKPQCRLSDKAWERLGYDGSVRPLMHITITHEKGLASAFAVAELPGGSPS